jgi:hypothetical protein
MVHPRSPRFLPLRLRPRRRASTTVKRSKNPCRTTLTSPWLRHCHTIPTILPRIHRLRLSTVRHRILSIPTGLLGIIPTIHQRDTIPRDQRPCTLQATTIATHWPMPRWRIPSPRPRQRRHFRTNQRRRRRSRGPLLVASPLPLHRRTDQCL